jgi:hypothetical protein
MKAAHHPSLFASRAAGPVTITNYESGAPVVTVRPAVVADDVDTSAKKVSAKRGPKPKPDPNKFAESENDF